MDQIWFVWTDGEAGRPTGPLSNDELRTMKSRGEVLPTTMTARGADGPRRPAGQIKGLFSEAELAGPTRSLAIDSTRSGEMTVPASPSDVDGVVPWSRSETKTRCEIERWWLGVGAFLGTMAVLFGWQVFVLGSSGPGWFLLTVLTVMGGMFFHKTQAERRRVVEAGLRTAHNVDAAGKIAAHVDAARGLRHEFMSLELPRDSRDADDTVVTLHSKYLMVSQLESNLLELVDASEIERIEPQQTRVAGISQSHSTFSSSTSSSAYLIGDTAWGSSSTSGRSDGKQFSEEIWNHKILVSTSNSSHPLVTLDFLEDQESWAFCKAALEQMVAGKGKFDQARVRVRPPEFNRNALDVRRWFRGEGGRTGWSNLTIQQKLATIAAGVLLLGMFGGPILPLVLGIVAIPGQLITLPFTLVGLGTSRAAMVGLAVVLGAAGALAYVPSLRSLIDELLVTKKLRPILATAIIWPILGQSLMCATIVGLGSVQNRGAEGRRPARPDVADNGKKEGLPAAGAMAAEGGADAGGEKPVDEGARATTDGDWKALLTPGRGWSAKFTKGVEVTPARLVVVDRDASGDGYVVVIEAEDNPGSRGAFTCRLVQGGSPGKPQTQLHGKAADDGPHWPLNWNFDGLVLSREGDTLSNGAGLEVDLKQKLTPVLWKRDDILKRLHSDLAEGTEWKGYEKPVSAAAIDAAIVVTDVKNRGENVRVLATAAESVGPAAVFVGKFRETESHPWGYPLLAARQNADYALPGERGSGLLHHHATTMIAGYRTDGTMVVYANGVQFVTQSSEKIPNFEGSRERSLKFVSAGTAWSGTLNRAGEPAEEVHFHILEVRNDGAMVRARLSRTNSPFASDILVGKLTPDHPGYNVTLDLKNGLPYLEAGTDWNLRVGPRGEIAGYNNRGAILDLKPAPERKVDGTKTSLAALKEATLSVFGKRRSFRGTLAKPEDGSSAEVVVEFAPKGSGGNTVQATVALAAAPQGRVLFEGPLSTGDDALGGYCLTMKKVGSGLTGATSAILGGETNLELRFRLGLDGVNVFGYGKGEVLELEPQ